MLHVAQPQLFEEPFEGVVDGAPIDARHFLATVLTPASIQNAVSSARPAWVVLNRPLATSMLPSGAVTLAQATTPVAVDVEAAHLVSDLPLFTSWGS